MPFPRKPILKTPRAPNRFAVRPRPLPVMATQMFATAPVKPKPKPTVMAPSPSTPRTRCPVGEEWDSIEQGCFPKFKPKKPRPRPLVMSTIPTRGPKPGIKGRCPIDEYWDKVERACYPVDAPAIEATQPSPVIVGSPEDIDEEGFSTAPKPPFNKPPIPESDPPNVTVKRRDPQGAGRPSGFEYPGSRGPMSPALSPIELRTTDEDTQPFYKSTAFLLGGGALVAYLVLK